VNLQCVVALLIAHQKPAAAALPLRHVDRIGELMEADDDDVDETMTASDSSRRPVDHHDAPGDDAEQELNVGGPTSCDDALPPPANDDASCVLSPGAGMRCHGDDDESAGLGRNDGESLPSQHSHEGTTPHEQQQAATGGSLLCTSLPVSTCFSVAAFLSVCTCLRGFSTRAAIIMISALYSHF